MAATIGDAWAVVLAGGDGTRLLPLTRHLTGRECPKQFCSMNGARTLLGQTLARVGQLIGPERTVVIGARAHTAYLARDLPGAVPHLLLQPVNRGTGAGILWPAHWVSRRDPDALVAVFPSDHFIYQERAFLAYVARAIAIVRQQSQLVVILGVKPDGPEEGYGWLEPGDPVPVAAGCFRVRSFSEKPTAELSRAFFQSGFLWNSLVFVARVSVIKALGHRYLPEVDARLARIEAFAGSEHEAWAVQQAYALMRVTNFSRDVLERGPESLVVLPVHGVFWSDWGTPGRVMQTLRRIGGLPPWLETWSERSA